MLQIQTITPPIRSSLSPLSKPLQGQSTATQGCCQALAPFWSLFLWCDGAGWARIALILQKALFHLDRSLFCPLAFASFIFLLFAVKFTPPNLDTL